MTIQDPVHWSTSRPSVRRSFAHVLTIALAALALLLSVAPGADAQTRTDSKTDGSATLAATSDCPDGWVHGHNGCQPGSYTTESFGVIQLGCAKGWVPASVPGGCLPGSYTYRSFELAPPCADGWVPASVPGGCLPGNYTIDRGGIIVKATYTCAFGDACQHMIDAVLALGGSCSTDGRDTACQLDPLVPDPRD